MRARHKQEIADLQENCNHPEDEWSDWMEEWWAPAHGTGFQVRACRICGAEVDRSGEPCTACGKKTIHDYKDDYGNLLCMSCYMMME